MGNDNQSSQCSLSFLQIVNDPRFGQVQIYRDIDHRYIMKVRRTHISGDKRYQDFLRALKFISQHTQNTPNISNSLIPIAHIEQTHQKSICIQYQTTNLYVQYFNYTLSDWVRDGKEVEEGQLWLLMHRLLQVMLLLKGGGLGIHIGLDNVFLDLKGMLCLYVFHIVPIEDYLSSSGVGIAESVGRLTLQVANMCRLDENCMSQEELQSKIVQMLGKVCQRYKVLGKLIKEMIGRQKLAQSALQEINQLKSTGRIKISTQIKLNKFKYILPDMPQCRQIKNPVSNTQIQKLAPFKTVRKMSQLKQKAQNKNLLSKNIRDSIDPPSRKPLMTEASSSKDNDTSNLSLQCVFNKQQADSALQHLAEKKAASQAQRQKLQRRKQDILGGRMSQSKPINKSTTVKQTSIMNKENAGQNGVRESNSKGWTRKNISQHFMMRQSNRR